MAEAETLCDRIAILLHGNIVMIGTPLEVTATGGGLSKVSVRTTNGALRETDGIPAVEQRLEQGEYVVLFSRDIARTVPAVIAAVDHGGDSLLDLRVERPSLEDRFLELTQA
jgi:ABC-2 type transport system ATP-binding protein